MTATVTPNTCRRNTVNIVRLVGVIKDVFNNSGMQGIGYFKIKNTGIS
jgi:hypothetical protein